MDKIIPIIIVACYFVLTVVIGVLANKSKDSKSFHGLGLGLITCVAVGAGEWLGGTSTTGVSEYGFNYGISGAWYTIANGVGICFLALFFAKKFRSMQKPTISGIIGEYIGGKTQMVSSIFQLVIMVAVGISQMIAIGTIGQTLFGLHPMLSITVMGIGVLLYTVLGGMKAVGKTNIMHMIVMYVCAIVAVILCLKGIGGFDALKNGAENYEALPESYFSMGTIGGTKISSWLIASLLGACVAQAGLQPILAAKDEKVAKRSSFIIALVVAPFGVITAILGMIAKYRSAELGITNGKLGLPMLLNTLNPYIGGVIMASIMAAVLSTAAPIFLSCGTLFTRDVFCVAAKREISDKKELLVSRISTAGFGLLCILLALLFYSAQQVLDIVYFAYSLRGALFVILLLGMYWKKISPTVCNWAMGITCVGALSWVIIKVINGNKYLVPWLTETYLAIFLALTVSVIGSLIVIGINKKRKKALEYDGAGNDTEGTSGTEDR